MGGAAWRRADTQVGCEVQACVASKNRGHRRLFLTGSGMEPGSFASGSCDYKQQAGVQQWQGERGLPLSRGSNREG